MNEPLAEWQIQVERVIAFLEVHVWLGLIIIYGSAYLIYRFLSKFEDKKKSSRDDM